ncbi:GNAT family N-acetyltransferase [Spirosoma aerophilum]
MIRYREATVDDAEQISQLHSLSWQQNYRGIWRDDFLNDHVLENRRAVWQNRLNQPAPNQYILVAESDNELCGFACAYTDSDPVWGTLLDNLHVLKNQKGHGIGTHLIKSAARWSYEKRPSSGFFLWVLEQNSPARKFYDGLGATNHETQSLKNPDGDHSNACRYVWPDITILL